MKIDSLRITHNKADNEIYAYVPSSTGGAKVKRKISNEVAFALFSQILQKQAAIILTDSQSGAKYAINVVPVTKDLLERCRVQQPISLRRPSMWRRLISSVKRRV